MALTVRPVRPRVDLIVGVVVGVSGIPRGFSCRKSRSDLSITRASDSLVLVQKASPLGNKFLKSREKSKETPSRRRFQLTIVKLKRVQARICKSVLVR